MDEMPIRYRDDAFMSFLSKLAADQKTQALVDDLIKRNYYKRLLEVSPISLTRPRWEELRERFKKNRSNIEAVVEEQLLNALRSKVQGEATRRETLRIDETLKRISEIAYERDKRESW